MIGPPIPDWSDGDNTRNEFYKENSWIQGEEEEEEEDDKRVVHFCYANYVVPRLS